MAQTKIIKQPDLIKINGLKYYIRSNNKTNFILKKSFLRHRVICVNNKHLDDLIDVLISYKEALSNG